VLMEPLLLLLITFRLVVQTQKFLLIDERAIALSENKRDRSFGYLRERGALLFYPIFSFCVS